MRQLCCMGAMMKCSFGTAPSALNVIPAGRPLGPMAAATIMDNKPFLNVLPFGTCSSLSNPVVAAATAAALGALTPMPCIPSTVAPWVPGSPTVLISNFPALSASSKLLCMWGGMIDFVVPASTVQVP